MFKHTLLLVLVLLAFIGLADSWYLADSALTGHTLTCGIEGFGDCNTVAKSPFSSFIGVPLAVYGVGFYAMLFILSSTLLVLTFRSLYFFLFLLGIGGFVASLYFVFLQAFVIGAFCIYCLLSALLSFAIFVISYILWVRFAPPRLAVVG